MGKQESNIFEPEENALKTADALIQSGMYDNDPLLKPFIEITRNFNKTLTDLKKIVRISDGQQEYLLKIQCNQKKEIEERVRVEKQLIYSAERLAELNQLKDKLFTIVSHDIRDPLAILVNLTELLEDEKVNLSNDSKEIIDEVKEQVKNIYFMVENLLEWFRSQKGGAKLNPLVWELSKIINEAVRIPKIKGEAKNIKIITEIREEIKVFADREALVLVLRNLLSNAVKYTKNGGIVYISAKKTDGRIIVAVADTGIGIEAEAAQMLFSEANIGSTTGTEGEKGTGLGLLICKELVQHNGGEIWVDSTPGKGSTFYFSIPAGETKY